MAYESDKSLAASIECSPRTGVCKKVCDRNKCAAVQNCMRNKTQSAIDWTKQLKQEAIDYGL